MKKILLAAAVSAAFGISGVQAAEDITVDVAVIGAGGAGLSAAVEAANLGAKVVVVEKMAMAGGNTIRAAGGLNAPCTSLQAAKGVQDSLEIAYYDTMKGGHWKNDPELVRTLVAAATFVTSACSPAPPRPAPIVRPAAPSSALKSSARSTRPPRTARSTCA